MNLYAVRAIYLYEMARTGRTLFQSIVSPVISTSLYFIVFGAAIGSRITQIEGVGYGSFIVPGLIMLMLLTQSVTNAAFGIYFPRFVGTIYEILSAPVSPAEIVLGYVGAAASKSIILGSIILGTSWLFVPIHIAHPFWIEAADCAAPNHHAVDVPWRHLLFDQRAAAILAHSHAVQSARLLDQRLPLELLRYRRCAYPDQRSDDARVSRDLHGDRLVVLQNGVPAEELGVCYRAKFRVPALRSSPV